MYNVALPDHPSLPPYVRLVPILSSLKILLQSISDNAELPVSRRDVPWADPMREFEYVTPVEPHIDEYVIVYYVIVF